MSLAYKILGKPFCDNALSVRVETGNSILRLLFDCGENVLSSLGRSEIQDNDHLFFSHFHMDHAAGLDSFIRLNYNRNTKPVHVWGPAGTIGIMGHRLQGFIWNLVAEEEGLWEIGEVHEDRLESAIYKTKEGFRVAHERTAKPFSKILLETESYQIQAILLNHATPCLGYLIGEKNKCNIDKKKLQKMALPAGSWIQMLKKESEQTKVILEGKEYDLAALREELLVSTPGESIAYLTDFLLDEKTRDNLCRFLPSQAILVCESQYLSEDRELAQKNYHLTTEDAAHIALATHAKKLSLIHFSPRYERLKLEKILAQAQAIFPETYLPEGWEK